MTKYDFERRCQAPPRGICGESQEHEERELQGVSLIAILWCSNAPSLVSSNLLAVAISLACSPYEINSERLYNDSVWLSTHLRTSGPKNLRNVRFDCHTETGGNMELDQKLAGQAQCIEGPRYELTCNALYRTLAGGGRTHAMSCAAAATMVLLAFWTGGDIRRASDCGVKGSSREGKGCPLVL